MIKSRIIGIDPGSNGSGIVLLEDGMIKCSANLTNMQLYEKITSWLIYSSVTVVVEDLAAYSLRLTPQVIDTAKFIGELNYRVKNDAGANVVLLPRSAVKKWCFDYFNDICIPLIDDKMGKKLFEACDLATREDVRVDNNSRSKKKASFIWVDDKIVTECMKAYYKISLPAAGKGYEYGLKTHGWQALACATCWSKLQASQNEFPQTSLPLFSSEP